MTTTLRTFAPALAAALAVAGCTTTTAAKGVKVAGPEVTETPKDGKAPVQTEVVPQISSKAKLTFDDAVKTLDTQRKAGKVDYAAVEKKFQAAVDADSNLAEAEYNLGVLAEQQGKTKEAVSHYREALSRKPSLRQAAENLAVIAQNQGDEKGAVAIYENILSTYPDDASSRARLAEIYRRRGEQEKAVELAREALFRDPKTLQAFKTLMLVNFEQKQFSMTRLIALRASKLDDSDPEIPYTLGLVNLSEKEPIKARAQFKKAIEMRPDFLPAHYELAKMAIAQENYSGAEEHLRRLLAANSNNPEALLDLGVAYKGMGQYDKAMAAYDAAQKLKENMPAIFLNRGIIIGLKGDPEKAITYFKQYIAMSGGEAAVPAGSKVFELIKGQEAAIARREEEKKALEEAKKIEEEAKKQEEAAKEAEKKQKDEELKKQQAEAKGGAAKDAVKDEPATKDPKAEEPKKEEPKKEEKKAGPPAPAAAAPAPAAPAKAPAAPAKKDADEPSDAP